MALFISKKRELRIIVKPSDRTFDEARRPITIRGERVEFMNHRYQTNDAGLTTWLKQHPLCGSQFICADDGPIGLVKKSATKTSSVPEMITGTKTTAANVANKPEITLPEEPPTLPPTPPVQPSIQRDEVEVMIEKKFDEFLNRFTQIMQSGKVEPVVKAKKTFTCPHCPEVFKSGVEVGKHKKLVHMDKL